MTDLYEILGVDRDADISAIRLAYRKQAQKKHPDKGGTLEEFQDLQRAIRVLSDPNLRAEYDRSGKDPEESRSLDDDARDAILAGFKAAAQRAAWEKMPYLTDIKAVFVDQVERFKKDQEVLVTVAERLDDVLPITELEENMFAGLIEEERNENHNKQIQTARTIMTLERALEMLEDYADNIDPDRMQNILQARVQSNLNERMHQHSAQAFNNLFGGSQT